MAAISECGSEEKIILQQIQAAAEVVCHLGHTFRQTLG